LASANERERSESGLVYAIGIDGTRDSFDEFRLTRIDRHNFFNAGAGDLTRGRLIVDGHGHSQKIVESQ